MPSTFVFSASLELLENSSGKTTGFAYPAKLVGKSIIEVLAGE